MAHGLPVVTTPLPLAVTEVEAADCGVVVPFGPQGVEEALASLLAWREDAAVRTAMGARGRARAVTHHSWQATAPVFLDALRRAGWRGQGAVPASHEPNRGFLLCLLHLVRAAEAIGEMGEVERLKDFIAESDPSLSGATTLAP